MLNKMYKSTITNSYSNHIERNYYILKAIYDIKYT